MKTTIDTAGRLVIPKELRREAGLQPGTELEIRWRQGLIEIEPAPLPVKLKNGAGSLSRYRISRSLNSRAKLSSGHADS